MTNKEYIFQMIRANARIYIDTASLMDSEELGTFLGNAADLLREEGKAIIVTAAVRSELAKHLQSQNKVKQALAIEASALMRQYEDVFCIEGGVLDDQDVMKAFADAELLAELTINKAGGSQLLITNDKKLSKDAYVLNEQESCRGRKIMVCYINKNGELMRCQCANERNSTDTLKTSENMDFLNKEKEKERLSAKVSIKEESNVEKFLIPIGTFLLGIAFGVGGLSIVQRR